jgi:26S proteasome regulatory subunit T3
MYLSFFGVIRANLEEHSKMAAAVDMLVDVQSDEPADEDLYARMKNLQKQLEFLDITETYIKDEMRNLKRELIRAKEEVKRIQSVPLVIGQFSEIIDANYGIVSSTSSMTYYARILSTVDREKLKPNASIALHR